MTQPQGVASRYNDRAWPTFERIVSSLVKDAKNLIALTDESLRVFDPITVFGLVLEDMTRMAPLAPKRFNELIATKNVTSGKDVEFLMSKYESTFRDVIGNGRSLWFANLGWGDIEADQLCEVFSHCKVLKTLILSSNKFSTEAAERIVRATGDCKTLISMDLADNLIDESKWDDIKKIWKNHKKPIEKFNLKSRRKYLNLLRQQAAESKAATGLKSQVPGRTLQVPEKLIATPKAPVADEKSKLLQDTDDVYDENFDENDLNENIDENVIPEEEDMDEARSVPQLDKSSRTTPLLTTANDFRDVTSVSGVLPIVEGGEGFFAHTIGAPVGVGAQEFDFDFNPNVTDPPEPLEEVAAQTIGSRMLV